MTAPIRLPQYLASARHQAMICLVSVVAAFGQSLTHGILRPLSVPSRGIQNGKTGMPWWA